MFWRITAVFFLPLLLLALAIHRRGAFSTPRPTSPWRKFLVVGIAGFAALLVLSGLTSQSKSLFVDLTPGNSNRIHPAVSRILAPVNTDIRVEMVISERNAMPARLKHLESGLRNQLRQLNIPFSVIRPEDLDAAGQSALRAAGLGPFSTMSVSDDEQSVAEIWSAMRVMCQGRETVIPQIDQQSLTDFQFLISAAVDRCRAGNQGPVVGFLSDLPRLSAAEAHQDYTQMGYIAPEGTDVYSEARRLLERYGYQVVYINPKAPQLPAQMDALVWLQPRVAGPLIPAFSDYLARGGKAFVALQQYNVQQRQYRGAGYQTVYWPQPQNHRMNDYLQLIGILQTGEKAGDKPAEVLFDANYGRLALDTRIFQRSQFREKDRQEVARPFLIRAVGPGLSKESPVTARLGALLFIWGNRFQLDESNLTTAGLRVKTLVTTSPQVWTYDWVGGWIPETALIPPSTFLGTPLTLAVQVDGIFPRAVPKEPSNPSDPFDLEPRSTGDSPGQLILAGCSEMFKNNALFHPDYQHQQLLLNAAAYLTRAPDLADLQARHTAPQMFSRPEPGAALLARALVIVSGPALFLLFGFWRLFRSRQALPLPGAEK